MESSKKIEDHMRQELVQRGWQLERCSCGQEYYHKGKKPNCGSYDCQDGYRFLEISPPKRFLTMSSLDGMTREFFDSKGFSYVEPIAVKRNDERTLFASAAGQFFDGQIYGKVPYSKMKVFCAQPVIRLQSVDDVRRLEGVSTSFVNMATENLGASPEEHMEWLDSWFDLFSNTGFYVGNITLSSKSSVNDWGEKQAPCISLKINYNGLEIGIANYFFDLPIPGETDTALSDISIGMERLLWAINKTGSYFDAIGPLEYTLFGERDIFDAVRTLTLMVGSGVTSGPNNHGSKFRMLAKKLSEPGKMLPFSELISFYHKQWSKYIELPVSRELSEQNIRNEVVRNRNVYIEGMIHERFNVDDWEFKGLDEIAQAKPKILAELRNKTQGK